MKRKVGISTKFNMLNREMFADYRKNGIDAFELSVAGELYEQLDMKQIVSDADSEGIEKWSFHLRFAPFDFVDIASPENTLRKRSVEYQAKWIKTAADYGFSRAVIHPSGEPVKDEKRGEHMACACESLNTLGEIAQKSGIILCVEDLPRTCLGNCSDDIIRLTSSHPALRVCFDTNHLLKEDNLVFLEKIKDKLETVHISDYDFQNERHWMPGEGKIDWIKLMDAFDGVGYNGVFMYEVAFEAKTIMREREVTPCDFRKNADELEARKMLTTYGTHYKKLGMWGPEE